MANNKVPVYCIDDFVYDEVIGSHFYVNKLSRHLHQHQFTTEPHRHAFYLLVYFTQGTGTHIIDFVSYEIRPGSFFIMTPGQVHHWQLSNDIDGDVLFFSKDFYENYFNEKKLIDNPLFKPAYQLLTIDDNCKLAISSLYHTILDEYTSHRLDSYDVLIDYLDILIKHLKRIAFTNEAPDMPVKSSAHWLVREFEKLIEEHFIEQPSPAFYAEGLNTSVKYLNQLCKQYLDKTSTQLIHERIILEAQRLLVHNELSINAVADALNFDDFSYFNRFFKKNTGLTPGQFRKKHG